ncbi:MAG: Ig-like domain-containing protein [Eubacteriales bacterium]
MAINTVKATINGTEYSLTYNGTSLKWEATLTAPSLSSYNQSGGYYNVSVLATDSANNTTTVDASNATLGTSLRFVVVEKVIPTITVTSPGASARIINNIPTITFQLRDNDSGINIASLVLKIDGGSTIGNTATGMTCTIVTGGYDCSYIPQSALSDGSHTITVDISDNDGNAAARASRSFTVDTVAPSLNVTAPVDNYETNQQNISVIGSTNDVTSSPVTVSVTLGGVDQGTVTVDGEGNFNKSITLTAGSNTIVVTATDAAGKSTSLTRTVILNTVPPVITAVEIIPNPADAGATYVIKVTVS